MISIYVYNRQSMYFLAWRNDIWLLYNGNYSTIYNRGILTDLCTDLTTSCYPDEVSLHLHNEERFHK